MCMTRGLFALSALLVIGAPAGALADDKLERTVDGYTCKEIMMENDASREAAISFLHGYILGKAGGTKFSLDTLAARTDKFVEQCLDNPKDKAIDTMTRVSQ